MEIVLVRAGETRDPQALESAFRELGLDTRLYSLGSEGQPQIGEQTQGFVVLDDGAEKVGEWLKQAAVNTRYLNLPVIAVTDRPKEMLEAGACAVCRPNEVPQQIVDLMKEHRAVQPVIVELRDHLAEPFVSATELTFKEMVGAEIRVQSIYRKLGYRMFGDLSAVIGFMGESEGSMVISFPSKVAIQVARLLLQSVPGEPGEDLLRDCIGELANVIAGQARSLVEKSRYSFSISTPTVIAGAGHEIRHKPGTPCLVFAFECEHGDFALQLCLNIKGDRKKEEKR